MTLHGIIRCGDYSLVPALCNFTESVFMTKPYLQRLMDLDADGTTGMLQTVIYVAMYNKTPPTEVSTADTIKEAVKRDLIVVSQAHVGVRPSGRIMLSNHMKVLQEAADKLLRRTYY